MDVRTPRDLDPLRLVCREEQARGAVVPLEISRGGGHDPLPRDLLNAVTVQEIEPPIPLRGPFTEGDRDLARLGCRHLAGLQNLLLGAVHFFRSHTLGRHVFNDVDEQVPHLLRGVFLGDFRIRHEQSCIMLCARVGGGADRLLGFDEALVKPARRAAAQDVRQHLQGRHILMGA